MPISRGRQVAVLGAPAVTPRPPLLQGPRLELVRSSPKDPLAEFRTQERSKYDESYFQRHYWKEDLPGQHGNLGLSYDDPLHANRFEVLASALCDVMRPQSVIDVGCGPGGLTAALAHRGVDVLGLDVSEAAVRLAHRRGLTRTVQASIEAAPFRSSAADVVVCLDVLEHIPVFDVRSAVAELSRLAKTWVVASINTNNPYEFHPTILSRATWRALFAATGELVPAAREQEALQAAVCASHREYEFFVYRRRQMI